MNTNTSEQMPENDLPRVYKRIEESWEDAKRGWRDDVAREFERSVCLPLVDALKSVSDGYKDLQKEFVDFSDATDFADLDEESASIRKGLMLWLQGELEINEFRLKDEIKGILSKNGLDGEKFFAGI